MQEADDQEIVTNVLAGDTAAFGVLVERYLKPLYNLGFRMIGDHDEAEEVVQTALVKAFEGLRGYNPKYKFFSWLYRITVNECLTNLKQHARTVRIEEYHAIDYAGQEQEVARKEDQEDIMAALQELKVEHRVVIILKHLQELTYQEIGIVLGVPPKTVKSRLFAARIALRERLTKRGTHGE
jgi:RNA polymerase sigma-70 factor, ECF subfamily